MPYVRRATILEAHVHGHGAAGIHELGNASGVGDTSVAGYWRFWRAEPGLSAALSFGSFVPTGEDDRLSAEGERLETEFQPGSGAWRPFLGATLSLQKDRSALHSNLRYTLASEGAQDTELGDKIDYGLAFSYRFSAGTQAHDHGPGVAPHHHHDEPALQWDGLLELTGEYIEGQTIRGETEDDFEHIIYFAPGIRLSGVGGWTTALSAGVPVYEHRKEGHVETKWRALLSVSFVLWGGAL